MNLALRRKLSFIKAHLRAVSEVADPKDIFPPSEVARLIRDIADMQDNGEDAAKAQTALDRHRTAVEALRRRGQCPQSMTVKVAETAAMRAAKLDDEDGLDY